ncbi:MAG: signal peptidase II [Firmicutes bacterium]|nr:signal peptidase II [Bacillota bacterium]
MNETRKRIIWFWLLAFLLVLIDQASKYWVKLALVPGSTVEVLPPVVYFTRVTNTGVAFGLLSRFTWLPIVFSLIIIVLAVVFSRRIAGLDRLFRLALAMEIGGAAGNLIDRAYYRYVVDFIDLRYWPVFNLADSAIVVGACLLALGLFLDRGESPDDQGMGSGE